jgi:hypothetical protein
MHNDWALNTQPADYMPQLSGMVRPIVRRENQASKAVLLALRGHDKRVQVRQFRRKVALAIFDDALAAQCIVGPDRDRLVERVKRRFGPKDWLSVFYRGVSVLSSWNEDVAGFLPDAFLIDEDRKTVVCYEIEDTNPLKPAAIRKYANAWWLLETIYWDLHLIAYDIYGNARSIPFPYAEHIAEHAIERIERKRAEA